MQNSRNFNNVAISQDDRPSRFLVDLCAINKQAEAAAADKKSYKANFIGKISLKSKRSRIDKHDFKSAIAGRIKRLAFFPFIRVFYQACFYTGWIAVFIFRFAFILVKRIISKIGKLKQNIGVKSRPDPALGREFISSEDWADKDFDSKKVDCFSPEARIESPAASEIYFEDNPLEAKEDYGPILDNCRTDAEIEKNPDQAPMINFEPAEKILPADKPGSKRAGLRIQIAGLRPAVSFALILVIVVLPLKVFSSFKYLQDFQGQVLGAAETAINDIKSGSELAWKTDFVPAENSFISASRRLSDLKAKISEISALLRIIAPIIPKDEIKLASQADYIIAAGSLAAELGRELARLFSELEIGQNSDLARFADNLESSAGNLKILAARLNQELQKVDADILPEQYSGQFKELQDIAGLAEKSFLELEGIINCAIDILGFKKDSRLLFVFQNNAELRASGGFIGSFALMDLRDGKINNLEVPGGGSYDTEGGLRERVIAPEPLHLVNPLWHFWDANWWPDWGKSAEKLMWFYEKSGGPTVDGIVSLTPTMIERLLAELGPIDMRADYGVIIDAENFWRTTQEISEEKPKLCTEQQVLDSAPGCISTSSMAKHEPKKIIGDLMEKIMEEYPDRLDRNKLLSLISLLDRGLKEKHILFYFKEEGLNNKIKSFGWSGSIKETAWDYLMVVNSNIAGGKTDRVIEETIEHEASILPDGSIVNSLKIIRRHKGIAGNEFTGVRNVDWMRIYVPQGSELIAASGFNQPDQSLFERPEEHWHYDPELLEQLNQSSVEINSKTEIYSESGKTVFANWSMVDPGKTAVIHLKYKLPFKVKITDISGETEDARTKPAPYALLAQKQPGSIGSRLISRLTLSGDNKIAWHYPEKTITTDNSWYVSDTLNTDKYWAVLIDKK